MLTVLGSPRRCCDGLTRRETLAAGALTLLGGGFNLPSLFAAEARKPAKERSGKAKNVILLYLLGGAATQDMWDLKPDAPAEVRGEFRPISTNVPGVRICEHLPLTARWMGSVVEWLRNGRGELPEYAYMPCWLGWGQAFRRSGPYAGLLGHRFGA